jgi:transcriptional regulator with GAF, ATPase, and Fis domain
MKPPSPPSDAQTRRIEPVKGRDVTAPQLLVVGSTEPATEAKGEVPVGRAFALPVGQTVVIGRDEGADVRIEHASVSRRHASLKVGDVIEVQDLGSANGTRVHDRGLARGERSPLRGGDLVEFGAVLCMLRAPAPSADDHGTPAPAETGDAVVVATASMRELHALARRVAASTVPVLLLGETGVGKEVFAERIHAGSPRAAMPYVKVNCGNLTESMVEAELFGHEKGAFTGAVSARAGLVEAAEGGTLFLDEVGELPPAMQTRLLRVLEDREVRRVGATRSRRVDVRFVAATNRDLESEVAAGRFRADLFYRLNGFVLEIPPLRERVAEIVPLALKFARQARARLGLSPDVELTPAARAWLEQNPWRGNIRELRNTMERAVVLADRGAIDAAHLPAVTRTRSVQPPPPPPPPTVSPTATTDAASDDDERRRVIEALERCVGNQTRAAKLLGVSRRTLVTKMERYGLPRPRK